MQSQLKSQSERIEVLEARILAGDVLVVGLIKALKLSGGRNETAVLQAATQARELLEKQFGKSAEAQQHLNRLIDAMNRSTV